MTGRQNCLIPKVAELYHVDALDTTHEGRTENRSRPGSSNFIRRPLQFGDLRFAPNWLANCVAGQVQKEHPDGLAVHHLKNVRQGRGILWRKPCSSVARGPLRPSSESEQSATEHALRLGTRRVRRPRHKPTPPRTRTSSSARSESMHTR